MLILTIRTDTLEAEIGLYEDSRQLAYHSWQAHRQLAESLHAKLKELLAPQKNELGDIGGIVAFKGPGSFTGLRIGLSVANALASALGIPIVGAQGPDWLKAGIKGLADSQNDRQISPQYGAEARTTRQKK